MRVVTISFIASNAMPSNTVTLLSVKSKCNGYNNDSKHSNIKTLNAVNFHNFILYSLITDVLKDSCKNNSEK